MDEGKHYWNTMQRQAANIIIGPSWSGKYQFIKEYFSDFEVLSVGYMQKKMEEENPKMNSFSITWKTHELIIEDYIEKLKERKLVVMAHTLFKAKRRIDYIEKIRAEIDIPIDIYVMQPSDEQILRYIEEDKERFGDLDLVKSQLKQMEIPTIDEGFSHVFIVNEKGIQDWSNKGPEKKILGKNTTITKLDSSEKVDNLSLDTFGKRPFTHICESCDRVEVISSKEAYNKGWDYPGEDGIYKSLPNKGFGIMSPRTCGACQMIDTAYWALVVEHKFHDQLSERQKQIIKRIMEEQKNDL